MAETAPEQTFGIWHLQYFFFTYISIYMKASYPKHLN